MESNNDCFRNCIIRNIIILGEQLKFKHNSFISRIPKVRIVGYCWFLFISFLQNLFIRLLKADSFVLNQKHNNEYLIASLTSFPGRIQTVHLAIYSLFIQTTKVDKIVLWLSSKQFKNVGIPDKLQNLTAKGLEIRYIDDYRSHKKYYIALQEQKPGEVLITFDDDILYDPRTVERLIEKHKEFPKSVVVAKSHRIQIDSNMGLKKYMEWPVNQPCASIKPSALNTPLTGSGCLYPFGVIGRSVFEWEKIKVYALNADDIWVFFNLIHSSTKVVAINRQVAIFSLINESQKEALFQKNCFDDGNDKVINDLLCLYPNTLKVILEDWNNQEAN